jgi:uncharacterized protein (TIGR02145 family)
MGSTIQKSIYMNKLFIVLLAMLCSNFGLMAQSDSIFPEMKFRTWVIPYKRGTTQVLFELKDSSVMVSNSARKTDYNTGHYAVSKLDIKNITEIKYAKKGRGYGRLIGGVSGFAIGIAVDAIKYDEMFGNLESDEWGRAIGNFFIAALLPIATAGIGAGIGALVSGFKRTIPIYGSQTEYDIKKASLNKVVLKKDSSLWFNDIDGNNYNAVIYQGKAWMTENLRVTRYKNGDSITKANDSATWKNARSGAICWFKNDYMQLKEQGLLYNWKAVADNRGLCPEGWHVATYEEWSALIARLSGDDKSKSLIPTGDIPVTGNKNLLFDRNFSFVFRSGYRDQTGHFSTYPLNAQWWTSTSQDSAMAKAIVLQYKSNLIFAPDFPREMGLSVRCVRD